MTAPVNKSSPYHINFQGIEGSAAPEVLSVTYHPDSEMIVSITTKGNVLFVPSNHPRYSSAKTVTIKNPQPIRCIVDKVTEKRFKELVEEVFDSIRLINNIAHREKIIEKARKNAAEARKNAAEATKNAAEATKNAAEALQKKEGYALQGVELDTSIAKRLQAIEQGKAEQERLQAERDNREANIAKMEERMKFLLAMQARQAAEAGKKAAETSGQAVTVTGSTPNATAEKLVVTASAEKKQTTDVKDSAAH